MATTDVINYYANLLIFQYLQHPRAYAHIQTLVNPVLMPTSNVQQLTFLPAPASGSFKLNYNGVNTASIAWNASSGTIQTDLNAILVSPLSAIVSGSIAAGLVFTFSNYSSAVQILSVTNNSLADSFSKPSLSSVVPIGDQLPLQVQNGFNLLGSDTAVGNQLDTIGKYVGVTRTGFGFFGPITLNDTDFFTLIQIGIIRNRAGSSLAIIQSLLNEFFAGEMFVFDYANMNMSYLISTSVGSQDLIDLFVTEGLLPRPMGVGLSVIAAPVIDMFFGFITYDATTNPFGTPFNTYDSYSPDWIWVSYDNAIIS